MRPSWTLASTLVLVACGSPKPAPVIANTPPPASTTLPDPEPLPDGCKVVASSSLNLAGEPAFAEVLSCELGEQPADAAHPEHDLNVMSRAGYLQLTRAGKRTLRATVAEWTDGWEWGGEVRLAGVLVAPTHNDLVLVTHDRFGVDMSTSEMNAFAIIDGELQRVGGWTHDLMNVSFSKRQDVMRVEACTFGDPTASHQGCGGRDDADPEGTVQVTWNGRTLDEQPLAPATPTP